MMRQKVYAETSKRHKRTLAYAINGDGRYANMDHLNDFKQKIRMSNQRKGKYQSGHRLTRSRYRVIKVFKTAQKVLEREKKTDEAFNFEQMVDWLQSGKRLQH